MDLAFSNFLEYILPKYLMLSKPRTSEYYTLPKPAFWSIAFRKIGSFSIISCTCFYIISFWGKKNHKVSEWKHFSKQNTKTHICDLNNYLRNNQWWFEKIFCLWNCSDLSLVNCSSVLKYLQILGLQPQNFQKGFFDN